MFPRKMFYCVETMLSNERFFRPQDFAKLQSISWQLPGNFEQQKPFAQSEISAQKRTPYDHQEKVIELVNLAPSKITLHLSSQYSVVEA